MRSLVWSCVWLILLPAAAAAGDTLRLYFATGKSNIDNQALPQVKLFLKQYSIGDTLLVTGYADEPGSQADNNALSQKRAAAARQLLIQAGIPAAAILPIGKGGTRKTGKNPDERRVDIRIRKACNPDPDARNCQVWFGFNNATVAACDLKQLSLLAVQLDLESALSLVLVTYTLCPICRTDSTISPAYLPLAEAMETPEQRKSAISRYLQEKGIDPVQVRYGKEERICFKGKNMQDTAHIRALFEGQQKISAYLSY